MEKRLGGRNSTIKGSFIDHAGNPKDLGRSLRGGGGGNIFPLYTVLEGGTPGINSKETCKDPRGALGNTKGTKRRVDRASMTLPINGEGVRK